MVAAAVRPWVAVHGDANSLSVSIGKASGWCAHKWTLAVRDAKAPVLLGLDNMDRPLIGDLRWRCISWYGHHPSGVGADEQQVANDSKAAA